MQAPAFFRTTSADVRPGVRSPEDGDQNTCSWCLERFDVTQQVARSASAARCGTNLMMSDNVTELGCWDACWQGAAGVDGNARENGSVPRPK